MNIYIANLNFEINKNLLKDIISTDKITSLNMSSKYSNNTFTVVLFAANAGKFPFSLDSLAAIEVCVSGLVKDYKGKAEIVADNEK